MDWTDQGIVLARRRHGESAAVVSLLTREHGRHAGLVRGGSGKRAGSLYQPGNLLSAHWRARLAEHLGTLTAELVDAFASRVLDDALRLSALSAAVALLETALPEREPHTPLFDATLELFRALASAAGEVGWGSVYARWEMQALAELGFGLDLAACAATGQREDLAYVSPRTGRAVSGGAGAPYADRLFALPAFLGTANPAADAGEVAAALRITGHFLERHVFGPHNRRLPAARTRFIERWRRLER
ncbi:MAG TPA: DNA repair protein RecO [Alphaproteobacteria bacterium]|nr:DNA repair protein RecO [Alphaproteobacteria bacterium]